MVQAMVPTTNLVAAVADIAMSSKPMAYAKFNEYHVHPVSQILV
jgi:hypothetical protein